MAENQVSKPGAADILVVDDDIASLRRLAEILSQEGYRVEQADEQEHQPHDGQDSAPDASQGEKPEQDQGQSCYDARHPTAGA